MVGRDLNSGRCLCSWGLSSDCASNSSFHLFRRAAPKPESYVLTYSFIASQVTCPGLLAVTVRGVPLGVDGQQRLGFWKPWNGTVPGELGLRYNERGESINAGQACSLKASELRKTAQALFKQSHIVMDI